MAEPDQQPSQPNNAFLATAAPWAETLSKGVAGIAIALYASGFLIVSLYHSKFGFVGTNPFRPRVLAAGAWFLLFMAIPVSAAIALRNQSWLDIAQNAYAIWLGFFLLAGLFSYLLFEFPTYYQSSPPLNKWRVAALVAGLLVTMALAYLSYSKKVPQWVAVSASVALTLYLSSSVVSAWFKDNNYFSSSTIGLWFFATTLLVRAELQIRSGRSLANTGEWSKPLALLFVLLLAFSRELYPHLESSWGGGTPAKVTVYFTKDSLLSPNKAVQAELIEEADEGFYIVGTKESKAIFVPRSSVAMIYFSDKPADSPMLQGVK